MDISYGERQFWDVKRYTLTEGLANGVKCIDVDLGDLTFTVLEDRCLDIYSVKFKGRQVAWLSKNGVVAPTHYDPHEDGWLKSFCGGLLVTCGLQNVGPHCEFNGRNQGLHGRISNIPAQQVNVSKEKTSEGFSLAISGVIRETSVHGCNYELRRVIETGTNRAAITLHDEITNCSDIPQPLMLLYHINFGYPLINPETLLKIQDSEEIMPRAGAATEYLSSWDRFDPPSPGAQERVYVHRLKQSADKTSCYTLRNRAENPDFGVKVIFSSDTLPFLTLWKNPRPGEYIAGLEPGNNHVEGVSFEDKNGSLRYVAPGETVKTTLEWQFV
ncbi:MAG: aldose 1-epimerase family protein [Oscillospiraceae bacterium]|nr:aldose 1-epimerase family protein [Oscillospiraceae bacterium]